MRCVLPSSAARSVADGLGVAAGDSEWERLSAVARKVARFPALVADLRRSRAVVALEVVVAWLGLTIIRSESTLLVISKVVALAIPAAVFGVSNAAASVALDVALTFMGKMALFETSLANSAPGAVVGDVSPSIAAFAGESLAIACLVTRLVAQLTGGMQVLILSALNSKTRQRRIKVLPASRIFTAIPCNGASVGVEMGLHLFFDHDSEALDKGVDVFQGKLCHLVVVCLVGFVGELFPLRLVFCFFLQA